MNTINDLVYAPTKEHCDECQFYSRNTSRCHRYPPPHHPVSPNSWCGEWKDKTALHLPPERSDI